MRGVFETDRLSVAASQVVVMPPKRHSWPTALKSLSAKMRCGRDCFLADPFLKNHCSDAHASTTAFSRTTLTRMPDRGGGPFRGRRSLIVPTLKSGPATGAAAQHAARRITRITGITPLETQCPCGFQRFRGVPERTWGGAEAHLGGVKARAFLLFGPFGGVPERMGECQSARFPRPAFRSVFELLRVSSTENKRGCLYRGHNAITGVSNVPRTSPHRYLRRYAQPSRR